MLISYATWCVHTCFHCLSCMRRCVRAIVRLSIGRLLRRGIAFIYAHSPAARVEALRMMVLYTFGGYETACSLG